MATIIYIEPEEAWDYVEEHKEKSDMDVPICFAEDTIYGIQVEVSFNDGVPWVTVSDGDDWLETLEIEKDDAEELFKDIYKMYLGEDEKLQEKAEYSTPSEYSFKDSIQDRDDELDIAVEDFFIAVWGSQCMKLYTKEDIRDFKERALKHLADKYPERQIFRPMVLVDEMGKEVFEEYPYNEWEF